MILLIPIFIKIIIFMNITEIRHNQLLILLFSSAISIIIFTLIELSFQKRKKMVQLGFFVLLSILMFGDVLYYSYFQDLPSIAIIGQAKQLGAVTDSIKDLISLKSLLLIVDIPFFTWILYKVKTIGIKRTHHKTTIMVGLVTIMGIVSFSLMTSRVSALTNQEIFSFHSTDIVRSLLLNNLNDKYIDIDKLLADVINDEEDLYGENPRLMGIGKDRNLILIQVESLQDFVINLEYNGQEITPFFNSLIEDSASIYFDEYYQLIGRGNTSDSEFVTNNSMHPSMEDATYVQYSNNTFYGLPWLLRDNGYQSYVFHGYKKDFWNRYYAYEGQGFQKYYYEDDYDFKDKIIFGISDHEFYNQTLDYLEELDSSSGNPFYSFIISLSSHTPYNIDEKYKFIELLDSHKDNIVGDYLQAIHYADKELGHFIEGLKQKGIYDNSIVAIYGDHFGINNANADALEPMEEILGEKYNFDHVMNVPMVIHIPGENINQTISTIGSQLDFYPTIINLLGIKNEKGIMFGKDLINYQGYNFVAPQTIMRKGSFLDDEVIFNVSQDGIFENSTVTDRKTRLLLDIEEYRSVYEKVLDQINASDIVLKNDLIGEIVEREGDYSQLNIYLNDEIPNQKKIRTFQNFKLEDLENSYNNGNVINRIVVDLDTDFKQIEEWIMENDEAYLILKSKDDTNDILIMVKDEYPHLKDRFIAEIDDFDKLFLIQRRGFRNIILNISRKDYSKKEIQDFLNLYNPFGIVIDKEIYDTNFIKDLNQPKLRIYEETGFGIIEI